MNNVELLCRTRQNSPAKRAETAIVNREPLPV
jgi:hypothetical protein